jgi:glutamyl/glutaminyl-tRNA synthetase
VSAAAALVAGYPALSSSQSPEWLDRSFLLRLLEVLKTRNATISECVAASAPFVTTPDLSAAEAVAARAKVWRTDSPAVVRDFVAALSALPDEKGTDVTAVNALLNEFVRHTPGLSQAALLMPLRWLLVGRAVAAPVAELIAVFGRRRAIERIEQGLRHVASSSGGGSASAQQSV